MDVLDDTHAAAACPKAGATATAERSRSAKKEEGSTAPPPAVASDAERDRSEGRGGHVLPAAAAEGADPPELGNNTESAADANALAIDDRVDPPAVPPAAGSLSSVLRPAVLRSGFAPGAETARRQPGAYSIAPGESRMLASSFAGSQAEAQLRSSTAAGDDNDSAFVDEAAATTSTTLAEHPMTNNDAETLVTMTTATLVQDGVVADATAVDVDAEVAEKDRLQREIAEKDRLQREIEELRRTKEGTGTNKRRCRIYAAAAVVCAVAAAGIAGGLLGTRRQSEGGAGTSSSSASGGGTFDVGKEDSSTDAGEEQSSTDAGGEESSGNAATGARLEALRAIVAPLSGEDAFDDEGGPRFAALDWIANVDAAQVPVDPEKAWRVQQRYVLALFYFSTGGDDWDEGLNFLSEDDECNWFKLVDAFGTNGAFYPRGVACDDEGRVELIALFWNNLSGTLPHEISNFADSLTEINLSGNTLSGTIPSEFGNLTALKKLVLNENCLSGTVPESLSELPNLEMAGFEGNKDLTGSLNGFCNGTEYKGNLFHLTASCGNCPNSPSLVQCDCCVCCDIVTYNCCDKEGTRLWNHANIRLNAAGQPSSFDRPCLSDDTLTYYLDHKDDLSWVTDGRDDGW